MQIEVLGSEKVRAAIDDITKTLNSDDIKTYIGNKIIEVINKIAFDNLGYSQEYTKHNKMEILEDGVLIYNDVKNDNGQYYSLIVEYGSGMYAGMEHIGSTEMFINSGYIYWYVPEEKGKNLSKYNYETSVTKDGKVFYKVFGQYPNYIYTDAVPIIKRNAKSWIVEYLTGKIGGK